MSDFLEKLSTVFACTRVSNVVVSSTDTIKADYSAVIASSASRVGVWSGDTATGNPIAIVDAKDSIGSVTLNAPGYDFNEGLYTVAFVVDIGSRSCTSICATALIADGQYIKSQVSNLIVTNQRNSQGSSYLTIRYSTPNGNTPQTNMDWILLFEGTKPVDPGKGGSLVTYVITDNNNAGTVIMKVTPPLAVKKSYVIEYNPGSTRSAVSCYYTFQFSG